MRNEGSPRDPARNHEEGKARDEWMDGLLSSPGIYLKRSIRLSMIWQNRKGRMSLI